MKSDKSVKQIDVFERHKLHLCSYNESNFPSEFILCNSSKELFKSLLTCLF